MMSNKLEKENFQMINYLEVFSEVKGSFITGYDFMWVQKSKNRVLMMFVYYAN